MADPVRAVVIDDEPSARDAILLMLDDEPDVVVVGTASNGTDAVTSIRALQPDLIFLDIQMPNANGFQVLDALGEDVPRGVIFVTAHDEYAVHAFEVHALDYVLKPFGRARLRAAVARAIERLHELDVLSLRSTIDVVRRIPVRTGSKMLIVPVDTIRWIEACGDYARIQTAEGSHIIDKRMHELEQNLDAREFIRIHRSCIVRLDCIRELFRESNGSGTLIVEGGVRLRVARGRWEHLANVLGI
jgi:two-component system LytT family response regulator